LEPLLFPIKFPSENQTIKTEKLEIKLSVNDLGVLINYGISLGVFKSSNKTEIINFFAMHANSSYIDHLIPV
jgi:hypothetical protein